MGIQTIGSRNPTDQLPPERIEQLELHIEEKHNRVKLNR